MYRITENCVCCGTCKDVCFVEAITNEGSIFKINTDCCVCCGVCAGACPAGAIESEDDFFDLIIKNAKLVVNKPVKTIDIYDIGVKNGKIDKISAADGLPSYTAKDIYDAQNRCLIPGLIEPHMHIKAPLGDDTDILDFDTASKCAAHGGVTTFMDFSSTLPSVSLLNAVDDRIKEMEMKSALDYSCHCKVVNLVPSELLLDAAVKELKYQKSKNPSDKKEVEDAQKKVDDSVKARLQEIPLIIKEKKIPTFKLFMTYRKANVMIDDVYMLKVMKAIKDNGGRCGFHAECNAIAEYNEELFDKENNLDWKYFPDYKPNICEAEAVSRVLYYAKLLDAPVYFYHISTKESVELIKKAQDNGVDVVAETCSHYLMLTKKYNEGEDGILYLMSPPLRTEEDQDALWKGLREGVIKLVSSDNCTFTRKQKERKLIDKKPDFRKPINGISGIEERFTLMRWGVDNGKISEEDFVRILSENPAKEFGCYPQKGCLNIGSDADMVIYDPNMVSHLNVKDLHYPDELDYSVFKDFYAKGKIISTIRRGEFLVKDGVYTNERTKGKFIERKLLK